MFYFQGLIWKSSQEVLLLVTHCPLPASARGAANGFWQIVSFTLAHFGRGSKSKQFKAADSFGGFFIYFSCSSVVIENHAGW